MKKIALLPALILAASFTACGPAAENRERMHARAHVFQDSIANVIKTSIDESEAPGPNQPVVVAPPANATTAAQPVNPNNGVNKTK